MAKHAPLPASSTARWLNCPGSVKAAEHIIESSSGPSAKLGTAAHYLGEVCLSKKKEAHDYVGCYILMEKDDAVCLLDSKKAKVLFSNKLITTKQRKDWETIPIDDDMAFAVTVYLDLIKEIREQIQKEIGLDSSLYHEYHEEYFELHEYDSDLGGTGDWGMAIDYDRGIIIDYKNGSGVLVEVPDNEQVKTYGLGLLKKHPTINTVETIIVQPRCFHEDGPIRRQTYTAQELLSFGEELKEGAMATRKEGAILKAGSWCTKNFCPLLGECPEAKKLSQSQALVDFDDDEPRSLIPVANKMITGQQLANAAQWVPYLDSYGGAIKEAIYNRLMAGQDVPGYKLVAKRSNRIWDKTEAAVIKKLMAKCKLKKKDFYTEPKFLGPAGVEKLGKDKDHRKAVKALVAKLVIKPDNGYTVALESASGVAIDIKALAAEDFDDKPPEIE